MLRSNFCSLVITQVWVFPQCKNTHTWHPDVDYRPSYLGFPVTFCKIFLDKINKNFIYHTWIVLYSHPVFLTPASFLTCLDLNNYHHCCHVWSHSVSSSLQWQTRLLTNITRDGKLSSWLLKNHLWITYIHVMLWNFQSCACKTNVPWDTPC